jgi:hypothetical protein
LWCCVLLRCCMLLRRGMLLRSRVLLRCCMLLLRSVCLVLLCRRGPVGLRRSARFRL